ncbi:MAG TPA: hypothetical protein VF605_06635 [Allosphingosinicella sp.]|jgi:hypothetical protein
MGTLIFLMFAGAMAGGFWQFSTYLRLGRELSSLQAAANEQYANVQVARAKRDSVLAQLLGIVREYADREGRIIEQASTYGSMINVLSSLPARFPNISADRHYYALMSEVSGEQADLQRRIEQHNATVARYNGIICGPDFGLNLLLADNWEESCYIGDNEYEKLTLGRGSAAVGRIAGPRRV